MDYALELRDWGLGAKEFHICCVLMILLINTKCTIVFGNINKRAVHWNIF